MPITFKGPSNKARATSVTRKSNVQANSATNSFRVSSAVATQVTEVQFTEQVKQTTSKPSQANPSGA